MLVLEVGLILLYYSLAVCAAMATVAVVLAVAPLRHPGRWKITALFGVAAAVAGTAFVFARQETTFLVYFGSALPFLFTAAFAFNIASLARWNLDRRVIVPALGVLSFAALIPVSSFLLFFLQWFEVTHLPITVLALVSLRQLLRVSNELDTSRKNAVGSGSISDFLERPDVSLEGVRVLWLGAALGTVVTGWQLVAGGTGIAAWLSLGFLAVGASIVGGAGKKRRPVFGALRWGGGLFLLLGALLVLTDVAEEARRVEPVEPVAGVRLVLGSLAGLSVGVGLLSLFARAGDEAARRSWATDALAVVDAAALSGLVARAGGLFLEPTSPLSLEDLERATADLDRSGARFAMLRLAPPRAGWTVPDAILERLVGRRLHVAVVEGMEAFLSPPLLVDEEDA